MDLQTRITVCVVALDPASHKFLLLKRPDDRIDSPGIWSFVTGHIQERETAEAAAIRELKEETNLEGNILKSEEPIIYYEDTTRWIVCQVLIEVKNIEQLQIDAAESQEYKWVRADDEIINQNAWMNQTLKFLQLI